jgi:hypothetical protein
MNSSAKTLTLIIGTVIGALLGYKVANDFVKQSESESKAPISASQGFQLGITALGALKQIDTISKSKS